MAPAEVFTEPGPGARTAGRVLLIAAVTFVVLGVVAGASLLVDWFSVPHFNGRAVDHLEVTETAASAYDVTVPQGLDAPGEVQARILEGGTGPAADEGHAVLISVDSGPWTPADPIVLNPHEGEASGNLVEIDAGALQEALQLTEPVAPGLVVLAAAPEAYFVNVTPELGVSASESALVLVHVVE